MSNIPQARAMLADLAPHLPPRQRAVVEEALDLMTRRPPVRPKAPPQRRQLTSDLADSIRDYARRNPLADLQEIATRHNTNIGRVSEALRHEE